jgi:hypothetical protein
MGQDVSIEAALPVFRRRCSELHDENHILRARVAELEQQLAARDAQQLPGEAEMQESAFDGPR